MKTVLITGSLGLTGSEAVDFFKNKGWEVIGLDNNMRSKMLGVNEGTGTYYSIDIRDEQAVDKLFKDNKFDAIIHTAGQPSHDYSKDHVLEDFDINARGTVMLLEATRKYCPEAVFVFCSTDKVYGGNMRKDVVEGETRLKPGLLDESFLNGFDDDNLSIDHAVHSPFGCGKAAADLYVQEYGYYFGMKTVCFRLGCITG